MPIFITDKPMDLSALVRSLVRNSRSAEATLERIKKLNPHIADAQELAAGTVVILPDSPDLKPGVGKPAGVQTQTLPDFADSLRAGLRDLEVRHRTLAAQRTADHAAVHDALKATPAQRLVDSDPVLKERLAAAETAFKTEQKRIAEVEAQLVDAAELAEAELAKMLKLRA